MATHVTMMTHTRIASPFPRCGRSSGRRGPGAVLAGVAALALVGCGGSQSAKSGLGAGAPPPPPSVEAGSGVGSAKARNISGDARKDYMAAVGFYQEQAKSGWSSQSCSAAASRFLGVVSDHPKLVEATYMAGLSYQNCGMSEDAEKQYQAALRQNRAHAPSLANLGELYFKAGKVDAARKYWETAKEADPKNVAARNNLAWLTLVELRKTTDRARWTRLEESARDDLSNALAVDNDNVKTYVLYGLVYLEGAQRNKSRLDLAKLLLDEGEKRDPKFPALYNARGLLQMKRDQLGLALEDFRKAVELDPTFVEARMNVGNITLGFRKYDTAKEQFTKVLELRPDDYDATLGLGVAQRGLGDLEGAKASYEKAKKLDPNRGAAYFNLGVLYKDFFANSAGDVAKSLAAYKEARGYFRQFVTKPDASGEDKKEAEENIQDCDKIIKGLEEVMQQMKQSGQQAPPAN